jgi:hypothetical protein
MIAYVERGTIKVGDRVSLDLTKISKCPSKDKRVVVMRWVTRVEASKWHGDEPVDEIEF